MWSLKIFTWFHVRDVHSWSARTKYDGAWDESRGPRWFCAFQYWVKHDVFQTGLDLLRSKRNANASHEVPETICKFCSMIKLEKVILQTAGRVVVSARRKTLV